MGRLIATLARPAIALAALLTLGAGDDVSTQVAAILAQAGPGTRFGLLVVDDTGPR